MAEGDFLPYLEDQGVCGRRMATCERGVDVKECVPDTRWVFILAKYFPSF